MKKKEFFVLFQYLSINSLRTFNCSHINAKNQQAEIIRIWVAEGN